MLPGIVLNTRDYRGRDFADFYAARSPATGPGFYVYGRNGYHYGGVIMLCARPDVPARGHCHYNGRVRRGWRTLREARAVASALRAL